LTRRRDSSKASRRRSTKSALAGSDERYSSGGELSLNSLLLPSLRGTNFSGTSDSSPRSGSFSNTPPDTQRDASSGGEEMRLAAADLADVVGAGGGAGSGTGIASSLAALSASASSNSNGPPPTSMGTSPLLGRATTTTTTTQHSNATQLSRGSNDSEERETRRAARRSQTLGNRNTRSSRRQSPDSSSGNINHPRAVSPIMRPVPAHGEQRATPLGRSPTSSSTESMAATAVVMRPVPAYVAPPSRDISPSQITTTSRPVPSLLQQVSVSL
jgi:hypothetical protein